MLNIRKYAIVIPILLTALLAAVEVAAQQAGSAAAACVGGGAIVGGERQPPNPAEVKARETSPECSNQERGAPGVDFSPQVGNKLDKIYRKLMRIDRSQSGG
jgi:hypothetical protein